MPRSSAVAMLIYALVNGACHASGAEAMARNEGAEAVVRRHIAAQNAHDINAILETLADTVFYTLPMPAGDSSFRAGRGAQRAMYARSIAAIPKSHLEILNLLVSGPVVVTREQLTGVGGGASDVGATAYWVAGGRVVREQILNGSERSVSR